MNAVPSPAPGATQAGWRASLRLALRAANGRTVLAERAHEGPLVVQRPFYPEGPVCHLYLVHPPGGVAGGDHLSLQLQLDPGAQGVLTTPAATKIYRSFGARIARVEQHLEVNDATLEWLPQETIVFRGARARLSTQVQLSGRARTAAATDPPDRPASYRAPAARPGPMLRSSPGRRRAAAGDPPRAAVRPG